jgi:predicted nucleotidyltransferase component of viral defense system
MWIERQAVEVFHLQFLRAFGARVDKSLYALKGGGNLRFFHRSIRFSEDIDLDLRGISVVNLRNHVDRVLTAPSFLQSLRVQQIELMNHTAPKQTSTTQRWKLHLRLGENVEAHTKIDFSRRGLDEGTAYGPVDAEFIQRYRIFPVLVQHYTAEAGFRQKINALASRKNTQARDVFDLKLLMDAGAGKEPFPERLRQLLPQAIECAITVGYDAFISQVFSYLEPEHQEHYRERAVWETLQSQVVEALEALRK